MLRDLYNRGLLGEELKLIAIDGNPGLRKALMTVYPYVPVQRCWFHKMSNVAGKLPRKLQGECLGELKQVYRADSRREAVRLFRDWASCWRGVAAKAVACVEQDLEELLAFFSCPKEALA